MPHPRSARFIRHFLRAYPARSATMVALLFLAGVAEGVGVATLLPVLEIATGSNGPSDAASNRLVLAFFRWLGLPPTLGSLLALVVVTLALKGLFRWLAMRQVGYAVAQVARELRLRLLRALMNARWAYFTGERTGYVTNALSSEAARAAYAYRRACAAAAAAIQIAVYVGVAVLVSWRLALLSVLAGGLVTAVLAGFVRVSRAAGRAYTAAIQALVSRATEVVQGIKAIRAMGRVPQYTALLEEETAALERAERRQVLAHESLQAMHEPILAALAGFGIYAAATWGGQPFSALLLMIFVFQRILSRFHTLQLEYQELAVGESAFWSLHARAEAAEAASEAQWAGNGDAGRTDGNGTGDPKEPPVPPPALEHGITFDRVSFDYAGAPVLRDVRLRLPAGAFIAVTGRSGAGKTTLVDLLLGLHRPSSGEIRIDDVPLERIDRRAWRRRIGYIPQETILFHDTIARNVSLGAEATDAARIEQALRDAGAWDFVARLPDGIETVVGERGTRLSGGERQRIAIARALVGDPKLLVLDEATTGLDRETEAAILRTLLALRGRITIVAVSHHAALADAADVVVRVEGGRVAVGAPGTATAV
ncbi:MAG TPA: ABC transporter ATP-binding protein [Longimicrobiales bacterium]